MTVTKEKYQTYSKTELLSLAINYQEQLQEKEQLLEKQKQANNLLYEELECLKYAIIQSNRARFGKKNERYKDPGYSTMPLFVTPDQVEKKPVDEIEEIKYLRRKLKKKPQDLKTLPRKIKEINVEASERICSCGCTKETIRYETKEMLHYQKAVMEVIEERREIIACPKGCQESVVIAPAPK
jgi:transposase